MPRIRTIKPEVCQSESMGRLTRDARLTFILIWTQADDAGRLRGHSRMIANILFPYDTDAADHIDGWLGELEAGGFIRRYVVDGDHFMDIPKWLKHQRVDKPQPSKLPEFQEGSRPFANILEQSTRDQGPRTKDQGPRISLSLRSRDTRARRALSDDPSFDAFWQAWPNKVGKPVALRAYRAALARASPEAILDGVRRYIAAKPPDRPWLNPSTFLTQDRWNDRPAQPTDTFASKLAAVAAGAGLGDPFGDDDGRTIEGEFTPGR